MNIINGTTGNDTLYGSSGDDVLDGGAGDDWLSGGKGNDRYLFGKGSGQDYISDGDNTPGNLDTVQLGAGIAPGNVTISRDLDNLYIKINGTTDKLTLGGWFTNDDYKKIEQVKFADGTTWDTATLVANISERATDGDDYFAGDAGANTFSGGKGNDTYLVDHPGDVVNENPDEGTDTVEATINYTLPANVENLRLMGSTALNGTGNALSNMLFSDLYYSGDAENVLDGGAGDDWLSGGKGNDTYLFGKGSGQDYISDVDNTPGNLDTVQLGAGIAPGNVTISRDLDNLYIKINGTTDKLTLGGWFTNDDYKKIEQVKFADGTTWDTATLVANISERATDGDDYFAGDAGANTFSGLKGNDTYLVDHPGDVVNENPDEGTDTVEATINYTLPANVENLSLMGSAALNGTGNALSNNLYGNTADNILDGGAGDDWLYGGKGNDTAIFTGSYASYTVDYNPSTGQFTISDTATGRDGTDVISEVEYFQFADTSKTASELTGALDTTPPTVASFSPTDGATGVAPGSNIVLSFSETIARGTGSIVLKTAAGATVETFDAATSSRLALSGSTLTIDPSFVLANGTNYSLTFAAGTVKDLAGNAYAGITTYDFTTASSTPPLSKLDDFVVLQYASPSVVGAGVGNDTYLLSNAMLPAGTNLTITDTQGSNSIQLASGLAIASSKLTSNTLQLTLSNGSVINILGANLFTYEAGGNATAGINLPDVDYATFVQSTLGVALPAGSTIASGGAVTIGSSFTNVPLVVGSTAPVTANAANEAFTFNVAGAKASAPNTQIPINGFSVANDQLIIDTVTAAGNITLAALNGIDGIVVQPNVIIGDTLIGFGADANGDVITITLAGIIDPSLVNISVV